MGDFGEATRERQARLDAIEDRERVRAMVELYDDLTLKMKKAAAFDMIEEMAKMGVNIRDCVDAVRLSTLSDSACKYAPTLLEAVQQLHRKVCGEKSE